MKYHNDISSIDAAATIAAEYRKQGYASYYLYLGFSNYQVRYWK